MKSFSMLHKRVFYIGMACLLALLLVGGYVIAAPQADSAMETNPSVVVEPMSGTVKTKITITGAGFTPGERVNLDIAVDGLSLRIGTRGQTSDANEFGAFQVTSTIPIVCEPGTVYTLLANNESGVIATYPIVVEKPAE